MDALSEIGYTKRPVILLLQSDEETSSLGSNKETIKYIVDRSKDAVAFFNLEPCYSETGVTLERKGIAKFELTISGIATHASQCYNGASALAEAANIILQLEKHKDKNGITFNCGTISGGTVPNVVPDKCIFTLDARFKDMKQYDDVRSIINRAAENKMIEQTSCKIRELSMRAPMPKSEKNYSLFYKANKILTAAGLEELEVINSTGGSDSAYITLAGIPVIDSFGVLGGKVHSPKEHIMTDSFSLSAKRIAAIIAHE